VKVDGEKKEVKAVEEKRNLHLKVRKVERKKNLEM